MICYRNARWMVAVASSALALAGCSHGPRGALPRPGTIQPLSNDQLYQQARSDLGAGRVANAQTTLMTLTSRDPADARAKTLLESITADPKAALGEKSFRYTLKRGETLRTVAEKFLGNGDKFYLLARYNQIAVPDGVAAGRVIDVPGEAPRPARPARSRPVAAKPKPSAAAGASAVFKPTTPASTAPARNPALAVRLRAAGLAALNGGDVDRAVGLLNQAAQLNPDDPAIARDAARAQRVRQTVKAKR